MKAEIFVGREEEQEQYKEFLQGETPWILIITGLGGIGKSALLRRFIGQTPADTCTALLNFADNTSLHTDPMELLKALGERIGPYCEVRAFEAFTQALDKNRKQLELYHLQMQQYISRVLSGRGDSAQAFNKTEATDILTRQVNHAIQEVQYQSREIATEAFFALIDALRLDRLVILFDTCELLDHAESWEVNRWLMNEILPKLHTHMGLERKKCFVVMASRLSPLSDVIDELDQQHILLSMLDQDSVRQHLKLAGVDEHGLYQQVYKITRGHPLCVSIISAFCKEQQQELFQGVSAAVLQEEFDERVSIELINERILNNLRFPLKELTQYGVVLRNFTLPLLRAIFTELLPDIEALALFEELIRFPYIEELGNYRYAFHELIREVLARRMQEDHGEEWKRYHKRALDYFRSSSSDSSTSILPTEWYYHALAYDGETGVVDWQKAMQELSGNKGGKDAGVLLQVAYDHTLKLSPRATAIRGYEQGRFYSYLQQWEAALQSYNEAYILFDKVGDRLSQANTMNAIGDVLRVQAKLDTLATALQNYDQALALYEAVEDDAGRAKVLQAISSIKQSRDEIDAALSSSASSSIPLVPRNPYKGLQSFGIEDAQDFFGRDRLIEELLETVQQVSIVDQRVRTASRLLTILGPSGSGKSSVVMAGLIPKLKQGGLAGSERWIYLDPMLPGTHPMEALAQKLISLFPERSIKNILKDLEDDSEQGLHLLLMERVKRSGASVLLVIDQFEELFTLTTIEAERRQFLAVLLAAISEPDGSLIGILTLRADFYDRPLQYPELGRLVTKHQVVVFPMEVSDLRRVVEQPARLPDVQLTLEENLVDELLFEMSGQIGALPLLQFTMDQLFERREGHLLTLGAYREMGGLQGALGMCAEAAYAQLPGEDYRGLGKRLFLRLVEPNAVDQDPTRQRVVVGELALKDAESKGMLETVVAKFVDARLLTTSEQKGVATVEVSHEALIRGWPRLEEWLREAYKDLALQRRVREDAASWKQLGYPSTRLYHSEQLEEALVWKGRSLVSRTEEEFLEASVEEERRQREQDAWYRRRYRRRIVLIGSLATAAAIAASSVSILWRRNQQLPAQVLSPRALPYSYTGHTGPVKSVAWSPDGKRLASASSDQTAQVWDASSGQTLLTYHGHTDIVSSVNWSPDGKRLASGSSDKTVQVWDASSGQTLLTYHGHTDIVSSVAWSPDGKHLASAGYDQTVQVWDASSGQTLLTYRGHIGPVSSVAWSPDGKRLASAGYDETVQVWDASSGYLLLIYQGHIALVNSVVWSPDSRYLASGSSDQTVQVWDASSGHSLLTYRNHTGPVESTVWSPDGKRLASAGYDQTVQVWDVGNGQLLLTYRGHTSIVSSVSWSPDGKLLASASLDQTAQVWDASSGTPLIYHGHTNSVSSVSWSPDDRLLASGGSDKTVQIWDASSGQTLLTYRGHTDIVSSVAWSPDRKRLASAGYDQRVQIWNASSGYPLLTYHGHTDIVSSVAWSPDGQHLASGGSDRTVQIWDASSGHPLFTYHGHTDIVSSVSWSRDGKRLVSGGSDKTVQIWDAVGGQTLLIYERHTGPVYSVAWSPDGKRLASAGYDQTVQIWDANSDQTLLTYRGHTGPVYSVAWSPDGKRLASAGSDQAVQMWDASSGQTLLTYRGHTALVKSVAWSPDSEHLASGGYDRTVRVWAWW